jgi:hypothetical protein
VTRPPRAAVCLVSLAVAFTGAEAQQTAAPPPAPQSPPATNDILDDTNLLLVEVVLDQLTVTDSLAAFNGPVGLLIPVGELSRLLDVDMTVLPGERRVTGNIGEARRPVLVDMATATIRIDGKSDKLQPGDMQPIFLQGTGRPHPGDMVSLWPEWAWRDLPGTALVNKRSVQWPATGTGGVVNGSRPSHDGIGRSICVGM